MPKISSTNIDDLLPTVATNAHNAIAECKDKMGLIVGVSCTYRNQEMQTYLAATQGAPALVSFHGAKLAFDVFQNIKKREWEDAFFNKVAVVFKKYGFTWMYDIAKYDKCHFQWDGGRKYTGAMVRAGNLPPTMPLYKSVVASVSGKLGLMADYWADVLGGKIAVKGEYVREIFVKLCRKCGKEYTDATLYAVADGILGLTSDDYWRDVIAGRVVASAGNMTALFGRIDAVI